MLTRKLSTHCKQRTWMKLLSSLSSLLRSVSAWSWFCVSLVGTLLLWYRLRTYITSFTPQGYKVARWFHRWCTSSLTVVFNPGTRCQPSSLLNGLCHGAVWSARRIGKAPIHEGMLSTRPIPHTHSPSQPLNRCTQRGMTYYFRLHTLLPCAFICRFCLMSGPCSL